MNADIFATPDGESVTAVTASEMAAVDRVAVEEFGLGLLQMMENAGRNLARCIRDRSPESVVVLAGDGGNGGGGLCCVRHLANRGVSVSVVLDRDPTALSGAARTQFETVRAMGVPVGVGADALAEREPDVIVDALVGYGLDGPLRGTAAELVGAVPGDATVVSLDVPSGMDATTGEREGVAARPDAVVTLALPKTGLAAAETDIALADIAIPAGVYASLDIPYSGPFDDEYLVSLADRD
jgi:NAD(P)H-hydrate epimerase